MRDLGAQSADKCGEQLPTKFFIFKFLLTPDALKMEKHKIDHVSKTKNCTKKIIATKKMIQIYSNLSWLFWRFFLRIFWVPITRKRNMIFLARLYFSTLRILFFFVKMTTSEEGSLHIPSWETTNRSYIKN